MPKPKRQKSGIRTYHVVIKGADRQLLFEEKNDYQKYLELLKHYKSECNFELFAYCLMSNHVHLLIRHSPDISLETIFRKLNTAYSVWFNMKYNRTGFVQNGRYFSEPVDTVKYLLTVVRYIHNNPTRAGLEQAPGTSYHYSSYYDYLNAHNNLTDTDFVLGIVGGQELFRAFHITDSTDDCCLDINKFRKRIPDDVAQEIICQISSCNCTADFQKLSIPERNEKLIEIHNKGVSIRQLNRLTGTPRGVIERVLAKS